MPDDEREISSINQGLGEPAGVYPSVRVSGIRIELQSFPSGRDELDTSSRLAARHAAKPLADTSMTEVPASAMSNFFSLT